MLYEILVLPIQAVIVLVAFGMGLKVGKGQKPIDLPTPIIKAIKSKTKVTKEEQRYRDILTNIEAYDGTSNGQKEIK